MTLGFKINGTQIEDTYETYQSFGLSGKSSLWAWGENSVYGFLGIGEATGYDGRSSPIQVGTSSDMWVSVDGGDSYFAAIKSDGSLWAWGRNNLGEIGQNPPSTKPLAWNTSPGNINQWSSVNYGAQSGYFINKTNELWVTGYNNYGQLGLNTRTTSPDLQRVGTLTNWKEIAADNSTVAAIKTDGTLWMWGQWATTTSSASSPTQVGSLTNWKSVSITSTAGGLSVLAVKTDGTLWAWGGNGNGMLGLGNTTNTNSPVQVGSLTNWTQVKAYNEGHVLAVKTDGTLWAWGANNYGTLGLNDRTPRSSPVQVGALTNWKSVDVALHACATKTDGTLWTWGFNSYGELGLGSASNRYSSPVQVGSLTSWNSPVISLRRTFAFQYLPYKAIP